MKKRGGSTLRREKEKKQVGDGFQGKIVTTLKGGGGRTSAST